MQPTRTALFGGREVLVARTKQFRLRWMATMLHTFVVASEFPPDVSAHELDAFMDQAIQFAKANKGGLPVGMQTGIAVVTVAVTAGAGPAAAGWASKVHGRKFAAMPWPALLDTATGTVVQPAKMTIGGIYKAYLQEMVQTHVVGAVHA